MGCLFTFLMVPVFHYDSVVQFMFSSAACVFGIISIFFLSPSVCLSPLCFYAHFPLPVFISYSSTGSQFKISSFRQTSLVSKTAGILLVISQPPAHPLLDLIVYSPLSPGRLRSPLEKDWVFLTTELDHQAGDRVALYNAERKKEGKKTEHPGRGWERTGRQVPGTRKGPLWLDSRFYVEEKASRSLSLWEIKLERWEVIMSWRPWMPAFMSTEFRPKMKLLTFWTRISFASTKWTGNQRGWEKRRNQGVFLELPILKKISRCCAKSSELGINWLYTQIQQICCVTLSRSLNFSGFNFFTVVFISMPWL